MRHFLVYSSILLAIAPPMLYSLSYFFTEKKGSLTKKFYLKYILLFFIFDILFFIFYFLCSIFIDFIISILNKYNIDTYIIDLILCFSFIAFYIFLMKKYFSFNDINLFFIINMILILIKINITYKGEEYFYNIIVYCLFFIPLCWILFFINMVIQHRNSIKRKKQSDANPSEMDVKEEEQ